MTNTLGPNRRPISQNELRPEKPSFPNTANSCKKKISPFPWNEHINGQVDSRISVVHTNRLAKHFHREPCGVPEAICRNVVICLITVLWGLRSGVSPRGHQQRFKRDPVHKCGPGISCYCKSFGGGAVVMIHPSSFSPSPDGLTVLSHSGKIPNSPKALLTERRRPTCVHYYRATAQRSPNINTI